MFNYQKAQFMTKRKRRKTKKLKNSTIGSSKAAINLEDFTYYLNLNDKNTTLSTNGMTLEPEFVHI